MGKGNSVTYRRVEGSLARADFDVKELLSTFQSTSEQKILMVSTIK